MIILYIHKNDRIAYLNTEGFKPKGTKLTQRKQKNK